jgi:hypothetical protein
MQTAHPWGWIQVLEVYRSKKFGCQSARRNIIYFRIEPVIVTILSFQGRARRVEKNNNTERRSTMELVNTLQMIANNLELIGYGLLALIFAPLVISGLVKMLIALTSNR